MSLQLAACRRPPGFRANFHWTFRGLDIGFSLDQGIVTGKFVSRGAHWTDHRSGPLPRPA